jgi:hypothetical protein
MIWLNIFILSTLYSRTPEWENEGEVKILKVKSSDNLVDLFTKYLPAVTFWKCVRGTKMRHMRDLQGLGGEQSWILALAIQYNPEGCSYPEDVHCTIFSTVSFSYASHILFFNEATSAIHEAALCTLSPFFPLVFLVLTMIWSSQYSSKGGVLKNHTKGYVG